MKKIVLAAIAVVAVAFSAQTASAQSGSLCQLNDGVAALNPPLKGDAPAEGGKFGFKGHLSSCNQQGMASLNGRWTCATGTLSHANCAENGHSGVNVVCGADATECEAIPGGQPKCLKPGPNGTKVAAQTLYTNTFTGNCVGANCSGGTQPSGPSAKGIVYTLNFNQATVTAATTGGACNPSTPGPGGPGLGTAGFTGYAGYGQ